MMSVVVYDCQRQMKEDEEGEDDDAEILRMVHNKQATKKCQFTFYVKN